MAELEALIDAAAQAQAVADALRALAEAKRREIETRDQIRLPLGDD